MSTTERIGARIAALRKARGYTQRELARHAHISYSLLTKVETGHLAATPAVVGALARALRVDVPRLIGQPFEPTGAMDQLRGSVAPIRRALAVIDQPDDLLPVRGTAQLAADVRTLSAAGQRADYAAIGARLPTLLGELSAALAASDDAARPHLHALLAEALSGATSIANLLGHLDLRDRVVDRIQLESGRCDDPLRLPRVAWQRGASLMALAAYDPALRLMEQTRAGLGGDPTRMDAPTRSVYGATLLRSAVIAARAARTAPTGDAAGYQRQVLDHLSAAREVAEVTGVDRDDYGLAFGPSNVTQHEVAVAVELDDGTEALTRARRATLAPGYPAVRRGHHYLDVARGSLLHGDHRGALRNLQQARRIAPQQTRNHPMVRETVLTILVQTRGWDELRRFSAWLGLA